MNILYITTPQEDYLSDSVFYGLRQKLGADVVDYPKKECMYQNYGEKELYGFGFTLWKKLEDIEIDRKDPFAQMFEGAFDYVIFSDIYRQQSVFAHFTVFDWFDLTPKKTKFVFLDGSDDGFPTVYDAIQRGTYFKRDNPFHYSIKTIGLSIPACHLLKEKPIKTRLFTTHVQCEEAFKIQEVKDSCTKKKAFDTEEKYFQDLTTSLYGITMRKSGWDTPRHMEHASKWVVNCIWRLDEKDPTVHPFWKDGENCIGWTTADELSAKIFSMTAGAYEKLQQGSVEWMKTKTCEAMVEYLLENI